MLLALDTSTNYASIALTQEERLIAELNWEAGQRHSNDVFERLNWLLTAHQLTPQDLTGIAVASGPGSFNGVRVALTTAKSLSFALDLPLYACPTLDVIAWGANSSGATGTIWALLEAGRGQVYAARYQRLPMADPWAPLDGYHVLTADELADKLLTEPQQSVFVCGEWLPATRETLGKMLGAERDIRFASSLPSRRASWLAELALQCALRGEKSDVLALEPLYLRRPAITKSTKFALPSQVSTSSLAPLSSTSNSSQLSLNENRAGDEGTLGGEETSHALHR